MPYVNVPNDLSKIKTKIAFNLTKRQLICFGIGAAIGVPTYLLTRQAIGNTGALFAMLTIILPAFLLAMYEKDGLPFEKVIRNIVRVKFTRPGIRPYRTENIYAPFARKEEPMLDALNAQYDDIISWADMYDSASMESKKMIVSCLIRRVEVYRNYRLHIDFNIDFEQFSAGLDISAIAA